MRQGWSRLRSQYCLLLLEPMLGTQPGQGAEEGAVAPEHSLKFAPARGGPCRLGARTMKSHASEETDDEADSQEQRETEDEDRGDGDGDDQHVQQQDQDEETPAEEHAGPPDLMPSGPLPAAT